MSCAAKETVIDLAGCRLIQSEDDNCIKRYHVEAQKQA